MERSDATILGILGNLGTLGIYPGKTEGRGIGMWNFERQRAKDREDRC
jgi:hypothetical protein